jgi:ABC-type multidrug transport system fused ATPase/permease subunit
VRPISLTSFGVVLLKLDWIFVAILVGTMIPVIRIEFRQSIITYQWRTGWSRWWRHAWYYRWVLAAYDYLQEFRIFRLSPLFINRYLDIGSRYITAYRAHSLRMQNLHFLQNMLANIFGYYGGLIILLFRALSKQITIGDVTMYMSTYRASLGSLSALVKTIADICGNHLFIQDLRGILLYQPYIRISPQARIIEKDMPLAIEFDHVRFEQLPREIHGKSSIFISHRFSTVRRADQILSLRHGQIDEQGTHEELMQLNGRYAALFRMQARWYG